jgi:ELWxxDGT repeat protein
MISDLNNYTNNSSPTNITNVNGSAFFTAITNDGSVQLFTSNGTAAGTHQLTTGSRLSGYSNLTTFNNKLYFDAYDSTLGGPALWTSDGTVAGTLPVLSGDQNVNVYNAAGTEAVVGSKLFFQAYDQTNGLYDLWVTNGTSSGTRPVSPSVSTDPNSLYNFTNVNGKLFFDAYDNSTSKYALWTSDGTAAGTKMVKDLTANLPSNPVAIGSKLYFEMYDSANSEYALWVSDGTSGGTKMVADIGTTGNQFNDVIVFNSTLYFQVNDSADAPSTGYALWSSNGTTAGVFKYGPSKLVVQTDSSTPMAVLGTNLYLRGYDTTNGYSLWKTDGVATNNNTGTVQTKGSTPFSYNAAELTVVGTELYFVAQNSKDGSNTDLWKSNGTSSGTSPVQTSGFGRGIGPLTAVGTKVYYEAYDVDTNGNSPHGYEPWVSDGTNGGTMMITDINTTTNSSYPTNFVAVNSEIFFTASTYNPNGTNLWQSDGTAANTAAVQTSKGTIPTSEENFTAVGSNLFFTATGTNGYDLWMTGTSTKSAVEIEAGAASNPFSNTFTSSNGSAFANLNGTLYFGAYDTANSHYALWKSDGTKTGTKVVADIDANYGLTNLTVVGSNLFWQNYDSTNNTYALWEYNGTKAKLVQDISPNGLTNLTAVGSTVFFQAYNGKTSQYDLYASDGTTTTNLTGSGTGNQFVGFISFNSKLFFGEYVSPGGWELFSSDGTVANTGDFKNSAGLPVYISSAPSFAIVGSSLYYVRSDTTLGVTDGTAAGTTGVQSGGNNITLAKNLAYLTSVNGLLAFEAYDSVHGYELWQSDGTATGTQIAADIVPGTNSSYPAYLTAAGSKLFFQAYDPTHGYEPWVAVITQHVVTAGISGPTDGVTEQHRPFVLTASDTDSANNSAGFSFSINWGDGTSQTITGSSGLSTDHHYATAGNFTIQMTATNLADNVVSATVTQVETITQTEVQGGNLALGGVSGANAFIITKGTTAGSYTVTDNGNAIITNKVPATGQEILLFSGNGATTITINDTGTSADAFTIGKDYVTFTNSTFVAETPATWSINGNSGGDTFNIAGAATASITAGSGNDTFNVSNGGSLTGSINGGGGTNTLSYSGYTTSGVLVDLPLGSATAITGGISNIQDVTGSKNGGDILVGDGNANVLKTLAGHNILIGGSGGGDTLTSGGSDIMIAGSTNYDSNTTALTFILGEWKSSTPSTYASTITTIETSKTDPLDTSTVTDSGSSDLADTLNGNGTSKSDWFFAHTAGGTDPNDTITGSGSGDTTTSI